MRIIFWSLIAKKGSLLAHLWATAIRMIFLKLLMYFKAELWLHFFNCIQKEFKTFYEF